VTAQISIKRLALVIVPAVILLVAAFLSKICYFDWINATQVAAKAMHDGDYHRAERLLQENIRRWPHSDFRLTRSLILLGTAYEARRKYRQAEIMYQRAAESSIASSGAASVETAEAIELLARVYKKQQQYAKAEPLFEQAARILEPQGGVKLAAALDYLGWVQFKQNKLSDARRTMERSLHIYEQSVHPPDRSLISPLTQLGLLFKHQGQEKPAKDYFQRAFDAGLDSRAGGDAYTVVNQKLLADEFANEANYSLAQASYELDLTLSDEILTGNNLFTADILDSYANLATKTGDLQLASKLLARAKYIRADH
jgi:TolA-binding protein